MRAPVVYRVLLWCYPAEFRHEYGGQMVGAFTEQLRTAGVRAGRLAQAWVWVHAFVDLPPPAWDAVPVVRLPAGATLMPNSVTHRR